MQFFSQYRDAVIVALHIRISSELFRQEWLRQFSKNCGLHMHCENKCLETKVDKRLQSSAIHLFLKADLSKCC